MKTNCIIISWLAALAVASTVSAQMFTLLHSFASGEKTVIHVPKPEPCE